MQFKVGDKVYSVYDDMKGTVIEVLPNESFIQDFYIVKWKDGLVSKVAREEVY